MGLPDLAASNEAVAGVLADGSISHYEAADKIGAIGFATTESSVRRYRRNRDITLAETTARAFDPDGATEAVADDIVQAKIIRDLKRSNSNLLAKLEQNRLGKEELVEAVYSAATDAISALEIPPVPVPDVDLRSGQEEVAVAVLGDWQLAKVTPAYNSRIAEERIEKYAQKVLRITEIQRSAHPVRRLHVWILGDIVEGELIFPGQAHLIDASLYRQVTVDGPRILGNFLRTMLANFESVHVTAIIGNHGALGGKARRDYDPETNADRMLYRIVQQVMTGESRITWNIPEGAGERHWYAVDQIGNYSTLLFHGDQIKGGFGGFPFYGLAKKVWGWKSGAIPEHFDDVMFGHYHQNTEVTLNSVVARCNGSTESYNTYAQEGLAAMGRPSQRLMYVNPVKGDVTAEYKVWLADGLYD